MKTEQAHIASSGGRNTDRAIEKAVQAAGQKKMAENIVIDAQKRAEMDHLTSRA